MANGKCTYYFGYGKNKYLIIRNEYPQVPPKVEYSLSPRGLTLMPVLECLCKWGHEHINDGDNHG